MKKKLFKSLLVLSFLLITFFSIKISVYAASFAYSNFDWDKLLKQNQNFWTSVCPKDDIECVDEVLKTKERFYTRLYELLDTVQKKYGYVDDNIIIATVFYGLTPDSFSDPDEALEYNPYNLDDDSNSSTKNKYIGSDDGERDSAKSYFDKETDSLKSLINNFIGYSTVCYGEADESPQTYTDSNGNSYQACSIPTISVLDGKCVGKIDQYEGTFWDSIGLSFLGTENEKKCEAAAKKLGYKSPYLKTSRKPEVSEKFFYDFLETSDYFDNKKHLRSYFAVVLQHSGYETMEEFYKAAENDPELLEKYKDDIIEARKNIIQGIKDVLKMYGEFSKVSESFNNASSNLYWWPIGSNETTESGESLMAIGDPAKTSISSKYGYRTHPVTGKPNSKHNGIDIPGEQGVTNVIASKDGVVYKSSKSDGIICEDGGDKSCGGGFGNYVIIQHVDNNFTVYAHLAKDSITVEMGDSVTRGEVIGKVGNSGSSTGAHLHFEVRVGGSDPSSTQDPLNFVSADNPRPTGAGSQLLEWIGSMEGTGPVEGEYYKVYQNKGDIPTVGHGITLKYNADAFRAHGINPATLSVGSLVPKAIVDAIYFEDVEGRLNNIRGMLSTKGVTLNDNQIGALASLQFNCGNINGFFEAYEKYGSTEALCTNWWEQKALRDSSGTYLSGLKKRRIAECDLFVNGTFNMNVYG